MDITKAYDPISRNQVKEELELLISKQRVELHSEITRGMIATRNGKEFEYKKGVPQGSILSPMMFALVYQKALEMLKKPKVETHAYADDIALVVNNNQKIMKIKEIFKE